MIEVEPDIKIDVRWQLIERIIASPSFQKSARIRELLKYMAERTLHGHATELTEHRIGSAVFGKPMDYSVVEDSSVRVHVRQLRLKLHEYFDSEGRGETWIVEIPKGAYTTVFRPVEPPAHAAEPVVVPPAVHNRLLHWLPWALSAVFFLTTLCVWFFYAFVRVPASAPWPLASLFSPSNQVVRVIVADANYGMMRMMDDRPATLERYLTSSYRDGQDLGSGRSSEHEARMMNYLSHSLLTSYADLVAVDTLLRISGNARDNLMVLSARELRPRDLDEGSFVFVGSPSSNPWVSYFQDKLNFRESEGVAGGSVKFFQNMHPRAGEQQNYQGLTFTGSSGEDYATISLLPLPSGRGSVLIIQGLQQEATEAAARFLADAGNRQKLQQALGIGNPSTIHPVYFEALIRTQAVAGAPNNTSIVATRVFNS
jgi:hypothetical protein